MCDEGRFTYREVREQRLAGPVVDGLPSSWDNALSMAAKKLGDVLAADKSKVGVVLSAQHTNEDNYALSKLARDIWQLDRIYVGGRQPAPDRADEILRDADINPNTAGVNAIAESAGYQVRDAATLQADLVAGELDALLVLGHDLDLSADALGKAKQLGALVVIAHREAGLAANAHVTLPAAIWAEVHGTITNRKGLVQRMQAAIPPAGQSLPAWEAIVRLARACDAALDYAHPKGIFKEMVAATKSFEGATWGRTARPIQLRFANSRG